jgi:hypothetical protein
MKEEARAIASNRSLGYWAVLLALSILLVLVAGEVGAGIIWLSFVGIVSIIGFSYRRNSFLKGSKELLSNGKITTPYDIKRQHRILILLMLATFAAFFVPLFLSAALNFALWFGSLLGIIDGWILGLFSYNLFLINWQKKNDGKLYVLEEWTGSTLTEKGFSFIKSGSD